MGFEKLENDDFDELVKFDLQTIWHYNKLLPTKLADLGRKRYISKILDEGTSFGFREGDTLKGYILSSIPKWDLDFFGFKSYNVIDIQYDTHLTLKHLLEHLEVNLLEENVRYCYAKLPTNKLTTIRGFETNGFTIADIRATLNRKIQNEPSFPQMYNGLEFDMATEDDIDAIATISKMVSKLDRFHGDPNFPADLADELYYQWVANGAKAGKNTVKCTVDDKIVGFHMSYLETAIQEEEPSPLSITDILGVHPDYGGKGIGTGLFINYLAIAQSIGCKYAMSGVHADNIISLRLHEGVGFKVMHSEIGMRKWVQKT